MIHTYFSIYRQRLRQMFLTCLCFWVLSLLLSCSEEPDIYFLEGAPIQFTSSLAGNNAAVTRVYDTQWTGGEKVGVTMVPHQGNLTTQTFTQYTASDPDKDGKVGFTAVGTGLYYPLDVNNKVNFIAFGPHNTGSINTSKQEVTYSNMLAQSGDRINMENVDFIYHKGTAAYDRDKKDAVNLTFAHKFSKIQINVTRENTGIPSMTGLGVTIGSMPTSATCSLADGKLTAVSTTKSTLTPWRKTTVKPNEDATFEAIVAPNLAGVHPAANRTVTFTISGKTYTQTISSTVSFDPGKRYIYNYKITAQGAVLTGSTISDWSNYTTTNDSYYLTVSDKTINADYSGITNGTLLIETNSSKTVTRSRSNNASVITDSGVTWLSKYALTKGSTTNGVTKWTLTYTVDANASKTSRPTPAYLWVQVDNLTLVVTVTQTGDTRVELPANDANCYIVKPGASQTIPVARAKYYSERYDSSHPSLGADEAFTAHVLWSDQPNLVSVNDGGNGAEGSFVVYANNDGKEGNAVVAIRNVQGYILWSWHIWVISQSPKNVGIFIRTYMSLNLGAMPDDGLWKGRGLLYQWGRKDPFTGSKDNYSIPNAIYMNGEGESPVQHPIIKHTSYISTSASSQHPHIFVTGRTEHDWTKPWEKGGGRGEWGIQPQGNKGITDPCPYSYAVPSVEDITNSVLSDRITVGPSSSDNGYYFANNHWPGQTYRNGEDGNIEINYKTRPGMYWTSDYTFYEGGVYAFRGYALYFEVGDIYTNPVAPFVELRSGVRDGASVRCMRI